MSENGGDTYLFDQRLDPHPQLVILAVIPIDRWERLVYPLPRRAPHIGDEVGQVGGGLELDLAVGGRRLHGFLTRTEGNDTRCWARRRGSGASIVVFPGLFTWDGGGRYLIGTCFGVVWLSADRAPFEAGITYTRTSNLAKIVTFNASPLIFGYLLL